MSAWPAGLGTKPLPPCGWLGVRGVCEPPPPALSGAPRAVVDPDCGVVGATGAGAEAAGPESADGARPVDDGGADGESGTPKPEGPHAQETLTATTRALMIPTIARTPVRVRLT